MWRFLFNIARYVCSGREPEVWRITAVTIITAMLAVIAGVILFFALMYLNLDDFYLAYPLVIDIPFIIIFFGFFLHGVKKFKEFVDELKAENHTNP